VQLLKKSGEVAGCLIFTTFSFQFHASHLQPRSSGRAVITEQLLPRFGVTFALWRYKGACLGWSAMIAPLVIMLKKEDFS
jgi:hypothetical protein